MSRAVRYKKHLTTLQVFLSIVLILLTACVAVKAFFLKAPEQKVDELPSQPSSTGDPQLSEEEQAAQEALRSHLERKGGFYTILVSGSDDGNGNSDTNILVAVDTVNGYVYGVSIPRDSKAVWDGKSHKINAAFGKGVHTESIADYPYPEAAHAAYSAHGAILEEIIEQGEALARIHPQSVNTLRIPTVVLADGEVRLFHPTLRVGRGDGIIDNFSAGGISALIDPETGCICSDGADKKGRRYVAHPDTGVRFNGYRLPEWDKVVAMVTTAAHMVPGNHYCGWDLAYSTHGWCMVEANCTAQMGGMQIITQTGRKAELEALIAQM